LGGKRERKMSGDKIIEKETRRLKPDINAEYLYIAKHLWIHGETSIPIAESKIAINVRLDGCMFCFNLLGGGDVEYQCFYGWAFILREESNLDHYKICKTIRSKITALEAALEVAYEDLKTLEETI
jgi:hypothetical protein